MDYEPYTKSQLDSTRLTLGPHELQIWSRYPHLRGEDDVVGAAGLVDVDRARPLLLGTTPRFACARRTTTVSPKVNLHQHIQLRALIGHVTPRIWDLRGEDDVVGAAGLVDVDGPRPLLLRPAQIPIVRLPREAQFSI